MPRRECSEPVSRAKAETWLGRELREERQIYFSAGFVIRMIKEANEIMRFYSFGQQHSGGPGNYPASGQQKMLW